MRQVLTTKTHRHNHGFRASHGLQVPLLSSGETHRGYFEVPKSAVTFKGSANREISYDRTVREKVSNWVAWKDRQGWHLKGKPRLLVPVPKPFGYSEEQDEDTVRVYVEARFYRTKPIYVTLDDYLGQLDKYQRYKVAIPQEATPENPLPKAAHYLVADDQRNPMQAAEQRRQELGLRRKLVVKEGVVTGAEIVAESPPQRDSDGETPSP